MAEVGVVGLGQIVGLLKLLGVEVGLEPLPKRLGHQCLAPDLEETHHEQRDEREREEKENDHVPQAERVVVEDEHAFPLRLGPFLVGEVVLGESDGGGEHGANGRRRRKKESHGHRGPRERCTEATQEQRPCLRHLPTVFSNYRDRSRLHALLLGKRRSDRSTHSPARLDSPDRP